MSLSSANRTVQLLLRLTDLKNATEPLICTAPQKTTVLHSTRSSSLPRCCPEKQGISSRTLAAFLQQLSSDPTLRMHSIFIVRNSHVICEAPFGAQDITMPRMTFSACKSVTALAIGLLMDDGLLSPDDRLIDLFPEQGNMLSRRMMKDITVAHLLQMQTGNQFSEAASMTDTDWLHGFFSSAAVLGNQKFHYNSLNTYVLSRIVCQLSGMSLSAFLSDRLFSPMGIEDFYWEVCPQGFEKGGWGLYMRAEDLAKLGQLILNDGIWNGRQLISKEFLDRATSVQIETPNHCGDYDYGWQFWVHPEKNVVLFNGMLGQNVMCFRDSGIVLVSHAGNEEVFQQSNYYRYAEDFFSKPLPHPAFDLCAPLSLRCTKKNLLQPVARPANHNVFDLLCEKELHCISDYAPSCGLLPVSLQVIQNSYTHGLKSITLYGTKKKPVLLYQEQELSFRIRLGTKKAFIQDIDFYGDRFRIAASVSFTANEDGFPIVRIVLDFVETPFSRILKLILTPQGILLQQSETPCMDQILRTALSSAPTAAKTLLSAMMGSGDTDFLYWKFSQVFSPTLNMEENKKVLS